MPGITIPDAIRRRIKSGRDPKEVGVIIAQEILEDFRSVVQGAYMIPAFGRYDLIADVLDAVETNP